MKILFPPPTDNTRHRYCLNCFSENVHDVLTKDKIVYLCDNCHKTYERIIDLDPKLIFWVDKSTHDLWHASVATFVSNPNKQILFIERTLYPYGLNTIPSGHLETGEIPIESAIRELKEESGIDAETLIHFKDIDIYEDSCLKGADSHTWHIYKYLLKDTLEIITDPEEGKNPVWLTIEEALTKKLVPPVKYLLEKYSDELLSI